MAPLKIALLSDLHAFAPRSGATAPSRLEVGASEAFENQHPFAGLNRLIASGLTADLLMCGGDMCDKADAAGASYVWSKLEELRSKLGARHLIATAGNHDVDSRYQYNDFDAKGMLQKLRPRFPGIDEQFCTNYWAHNFAVHEEADFRIVALNSAAFHGAGKDAGKEFQHGRVSNYTMQSIAETLKGSSPKKVNFLLCHHHPIDHNTLKFADYSRMDGGDVLLGLLPPLFLGPWVVIHGHKHSPGLMYSGGGSSSALIFSLGSFSALLDSRYFVRDKNQFYLLEVELPVHPGDELQGSVQAWDWVDMEGWVPADPRSAIPARSGFGYRAGLNSLANTIATEVRKHQQYLTYDEIRKAVPAIHYVLSKDILELRHLLKVVFSLKLNCVSDSVNAFDEISA